MNARAQAPAGDALLDMRETARFCSALFKRVDPSGYIALRVFDGSSNAVLFSEGVQLCAENFADRVRRASVVAATTGTASVSCPPVATFNNPDRARVADLREAPAILVECDSKPSGARVTLNEHLGRPMLVVESGGLWLDAETGELEPKLHLYWRLRMPSRSAAEQKDLRTVRKLACDLVGADASAVSLADRVP